MFCLPKTAWPPTSCALIVGTTMILGMGRAKYAWVTAVPGILMIPVTMTAGSRIVAMSFCEPRSW